MMDMQSRRRNLIIYACALVTVFYTFFVSRLMLSRDSQPAITYASMSERDIEDHEKTEITDHDKNKNRADTGDASSATGPTKKRKRSMSRVGVSSASGATVKRKMAMFSDEDMLLMTSMIDAVNIVAAAIRKTPVNEVHPDLYGTVMCMPGFPDEDLVAAFCYLVDKKAQGNAFMVMSDKHRVLWMIFFLAKHHI